MIKDLVEEIDEELHRMEDSNESSFQRISQMKGVLINLQQIEKEPLVALRKTQKNVQQKIMRILELQCQETNLKEGIQALNHELDELCHTKAHSSLILAGELKETRKLDILLQFLKSDRERRNIESARYVSDLDNAREKIQEKLRLLEKFACITQNSF